VHVLQHPAGGNLVDPDDQLLGDVHHHDKRRHPTGGVGDVVADLAEGAAQEEVGGPAGLFVLRLDGEEALAPAVEEVGHLDAVPGDDLHRQLELEAAPRGPGAFDAQGLAELDQVGLEVGALRSLGTGPLLGQCLQGGDVRHGPNMRRRRDDGHGRRFPVLQR
jgi:hypothetical protein